MMENFDKMINDPETIGKRFRSGSKEYKITMMDNFEYIDPVDHSVSKNQVCMLG